MLTTVSYVTIAVVSMVMVYIAFQYSGLKKLSEGTPQIAALAGRIRNGSKVFIGAIYKRILPVSILIAAIFSLFVETFAGFAFLGGMICTSICVIVGMSAATYANARVAATALQNMKEDKSIASARTVNTTIKGSQICGLIVNASTLLGLALVVLFTGVDANATGHGIITTSPTILSSARLTAYSLGWSVVAMFCRVPGGIFTKAADIGADLIGKVFMHFEEDDPRNPAVLADLVGDNVNDIAGNQADLGESYTATPVTAIVTAINMYGLIADPKLLTATATFPFILAIGGLISSLIGLYKASHTKKSSDPARQLNISLWIAVAGPLITSFVASYLMFGVNDLAPAEFRFGWISLFISVVCGIAAGVGVGLVAQYFTNLKSKWCIEAAEHAKQGASLYVSFTNAAGWVSCFFEVVIVAVLSWCAWKVAGPYGQANMALGMLSFVGQPIAADAFGPISDNAGGIAESCGLPPEVRAITDENDAHGNSTAAVGKGFAIGSAAAVLLSQISTFMMAAGESSLDLMSGDVMLGLLLGGGLMATFCGLLGVYTLQAADEMAAECRKQLLDPEVVNGKKEPDAKACIRIATEYAIRKMLIPVAIAIGATLAIGFIFGPRTLGGTLTGTMVVGLPLAIYFSNAGGLADNGKKRYETNLVTGFEKWVTDKYLPAHDATVVGDTMGDWMKDVVAVAVDIFMKIMGMLAMMLAYQFAAHYLLQSFM